MIPQQPGVPAPVVDSAPVEEAVPVRVRSFKAAQTVIVDRPAATVFAYRSALASSPEWRRGVVSACLDPPGPVWVGSRCTEVRAAADDSTEEWELEVTDYDPITLLGIVSRRGEAEVREQHQFASDGGSTRYTVSAEVTGGSLSGPAFQKALLENLLQLKWALEGVHTATWNLSRRRAGR